MSNLKNKIKAKQFVITAEIVPPLSAAGTKLLHEAAQLKGKVDGINITDAAAGMQTYADGEPTGATPGRLVRFGQNSAG